MKDLTKRKQLVDMLTYRRRAGTEGEAAFIAKYIDSVQGMLKDDYGNRWILIGNTKTMFSCHVDSVHSTRIEGIEQAVLVDSAYTRAFRADDAEDCLGADDAVGCFIMLEMIARGVPGLYVFHKDEEIGGLGSSYISTADEWTLMLDSIDRAVAFDRMGTDSVITHQMGRCCSDVFADALCSALNSTDIRINYMNDSTGVFTDTANYTSIIPECTNLSCGYYNEHTPDEYVDINHVMMLLEAA